MPDPFIRVARGYDDLAAVSALFLEYAESLNFDLCFQGFDIELASLPGKYTPPGGELWLAHDGAEAVGCVGLRPLNARDCEMKRLYVQPQGRRFGLGRRLAETAIQFAADAAYRSVKLDTISSQMAAAEQMYQKLGFRRIDAYYANPVESAAFYGLDLPKRA